MTNVDFGFSEFTTWPWSFSQDLERYKAHGATCIEICEFKLPHEDYGSMLRALEQSGLEASSVQMQVHSVFKDSMASKPSDPRDRIEQMKRAIAATAPHVRKGTPFIVITGVPPKKNIREAVDRTVDALKELGEFAAEHEMRIAFEPLSPVNLHTDTAVWYLDQGLELIQRVAHPAVGICIDSWNVWQTPNLDGVIRECGDRIFLVQLSDWQTPRSTADRYSLGDGCIPLLPMMRAIRKTGYAGPWVVEILSSFHLEGSLWKQDLDAVLERNREAFNRLWDESEPRPYETEWTANTARTP
jgi:sugar phosphate isomerase/epimerase